MTTGAGTGLPPGAVFEGGRVVRHLVEHKNGREMEVTRGVSFTIKEARETGTDFWDPELGWLRYGRKTENENPLPPPASTMLRAREQVAADSLPAQE